MHSNPFSSVGHDLSEIMRRLNNKADQHEIHSLRSEVEQLQRDVQVFQSENEELRRQLHALDDRIGNLADQIARDD